MRYFREVLNRRNVTIDVKHYEDCEQLFISVGHCYLVQALLEFFKIENVDESPNANSTFLSNNMTEEEKKEHLLAELQKFVDEYVLETLNDDSMESSDEDNSDGVLNYSLNLLKSFMVLLDCKDAVASGNGEHLALIQKQMLFYFSSVSGYNSYAIEMLISIIQNEVLLSPAEAHHCKWAALANWKGGRDKNIEIDLLQENRNSDLKELTRLMRANKTEKAIERISKAVTGIRKVVNVFEDQAFIKRKSSAHSHKSSLEDENKVLSDLQRLMPFSSVPGRSHSSFVEISADPLHELDEKKFTEWLQKHQKNISLHFPTLDDAESTDEESADIGNLLSSLQVDDIYIN